MDSDKLNATKLINLDWSSGFLGPVPFVVKPFHNNHPSTTDSSTRLSITRPVPMNILDPAPAFRDICLLLDNLSQFQQLLNADNIANYSSAHNDRLPATKRCRVGSSSKSIQSIPSFVTLRRRPLTSLPVESNEHWELTSGKVIKFTMDTRDMHLRFLEKQHTKLKEVLAVRKGSPLINEAWYGNLESKYRVAFVDPKCVPITSRMQELNEFILDGVLPNADALKPPRPLKNVHVESRMKTALIRELCNSAYRIKEEQFFQDGNHRTAILSIYEALADVNVVLDVHPLRLYAIISNRLERRSEEVLENLFQLVWKNHHTSIMTLERRVKNAMAVKHLQFWNTQVENFYVQLTSVRKEEARVLLRRCKRTNRRLFTGLRELHGLDQWS